MWCSPVKQGLKEWRAMGKKESTHHIWTLKTLHSTYQCLYNSSCSVNLTWKNYIFNVKTWHNIYCGCLWRNGLISDFIDQFSYSEKLDKDSGSVRYSWCVCKEIKLLKICFSDKNKSMTKCKQALGLFGMVLLYMSGCVCTCVIKP